MGNEKVKSGAVYLERIKSKVGTGDTAKAAVMENYWRAEPQDDGKIKMELLDNQDQPSGYAEIVDLEEMESRFYLVEGWQPRKRDPKKEKADKLTARAERHLEKKEYLSAEFEYSNALKLDEENVRANFGLGKTYLAMGETEKARNIFGKLSNIDAVLEASNKHIFNECGMQLRKLGMHEEAIDYYRRALGLAKDDENLWFNFGRALWEGGHKDKAVSAIKQAASLNPDMVEAKAMLKQMAK
jgi:tetratricopeptide (TPR) repeat protein